PVSAPQSSPLNFTPGASPEAPHTPPLHALVLIGGGMPQAYSYAAGDISEAELRPGRIVEVPLVTRTVSGVVVESGRAPLPFKLKKITRLAPDDAAVPAEWIELLRWVASYYLTPLPVVLMAALPKAATHFL